MKQPDHLPLNNLDGKKDFSVFGCLVESNQQCVSLPEEKLKRDADKANHHLLYLWSLLAKY